MNTNWMSPVDLISGTPLNWIPSHGPLRYTFRCLFHRKASGSPWKSNRNEFDPEDGSRRLFHEVRYLSRPKPRSQPNFIPGSSVSVGESKLCHIYKLGSPFPSLTTRLPLSRSCTSGFAGFAAEVRLDDQRTPRVPVDRTSRLPPGPTARETEEKFEMGESRLATQT
ncbi:hypothetical protein MLD38_039839 [Melastoma candidum]|uniref:Uncharacterized protein n=1 Tax=Melastoma candidum TaxID=119954 RepID=A0ACB9L433_9MYRT|nr:hypothetical protein MLD38_039839 [Melastoma candidum]